MYVLKNYTLWAHRGNAGSSIHDENQMDNSIEAVRASITRPYVDGFELDFRLTKDGVLVVTHDKDLKDIAGDMPKSIVHDIVRKKDKREISNMTLEELQAENLHDIYYYYKGLMARAKLFNFPEKQRLVNIMEAKLDSRALIPTGDDMIKYIVDTNPDKKLLLELKENTQACADSLSALINKYKDRIDISSHGYAEKLMLSIGEQTGTPVGVLIKHDQTGPLAKLVGNPDRLSDDYIKNMPFDFYSVMWCWLKANQMKVLLENNKGFNFWTVDSGSHLGGPYPKYLGIIDGVLDRLETLEREYGMRPEEYGVKPGIITNMPDVIHDELENGKSR